jgi:hypothetical protein
MNGLIRAFRLFACSLLLLAFPASAVPNRIGAIADAITEIDIERAQRLLEGAHGDSQALALERARLAIYMGDCDRASVILAAPSLGESRDGAFLSEVAKSCAKATVAGFVMEDKARGIWLRMQDDADRALAPYLFDIAARARDAITREMHVDMPRPLRIDLVRDLFSLSAVSGLPVTAAETTGTLAVARWGRVIMLSPRATPLGYPWEDTLAHEITHLLITRATRDHGPLWLQEGLAKRFESRWRSERPFDNPGWADNNARLAAVEGRSIGIDHLGPSIAMLPTAEAAGTAFAEVTSFMKFWIEQNGEPALRLLFADLRGNGAAGPDAALKSVTGYTLAEWNARWQKHLTEGPDTAVKPAHATPGVKGDVRELARRVRLGDLLFSQGQAKAAAIELDPTLDMSPREPAIRWRVARANLLSDKQEPAAKGLGSLAEIDSLHGPWNGLRGRFLQQSGDHAGARSAFDLGRSLDPLSEDVACEGQLSRKGDPAPPSFPADPNQKQLCEAARAVARD